MHPLFQAGAFGGDDDTRPTAVLVGRGDEPLPADGGDVDVENAVEHPTGLVIDQVDRPKHQAVNQFPDRPIAQGLPSQIQEMEADYQQDKQTHVDRAAVLRVLAICLDVVDAHRKEFGC